MYNITSLKTLGVSKAMSKILFLFFALTNFYSVSQISNSTREYQERYVKNLYGNFEMIGNSNMKCVSNCDATPVWNNPPNIMGYSDIDGDSSTHNSSRATLTIPSGATVKWAGLYWGGVSGSTLFGICSPLNSNKDVVKFKLPGAGTYVNVNASVRNYETTFQPGWKTFLAFADVTNMVKSAGSGQYFVSDISLDTGVAFTGPLGGWTLVVVYESMSETSKRINVWDGFKFFGFGDNDDFTVTGLLTPSAGVVNTNVGYFAMDGERNVSGDFVSVNGTMLSNGMNPTNNTLNGTISKFGVNQPGKHPDFDYSWAVDIDVFDASGLVPNNASSVLVNLGSSNEGIWGGVFVISNEIANPTLTKTFSPEFHDIGDVSTITLALTNPSNGVGLTNISVTDNLPVGMVIADIPNVNETCGGSVTANPGASTFNLDSFSLNAGQTCTVSFDVKSTQVGVHTNEVTVFDVTNNQKIEITGPANATLSVFDSFIVVTDALCFEEASGSLDLSVSGGTPPYTYLWNNGDTNQDLINVLAGNYSVVITDSNGYTTIAAATIQEPSSGLSSTIAITNVGCFGTNTGSLDLTVLGGKPPYSFAWTPNGETTEDLFNLVAGTYSVAITDANGCTTSIDVTILTNCILAIDDINNTFVNLPVSGNVGTNDENPDGPAGTEVFTLVMGPTNGNVVLNADGSYTYTPATDYVGEDTFEYEVCDAGNPIACDTATVYIEVLPISGPDNETPVANADTNTTEVDTPVMGTVLPNDFDPDGDPITVTGNTDPSNGTLVINPDGTYTYTPDPGFEGEDSFEYTVCDNGTPALCDTATVTIQVLPDTGNITVANDDVYNSTSGNPIGGSVLDNDNDPEGNTQRVNTTVVSGPANGSVVLNADGTFVYTPNDPTFTGMDQFVYEVCDDGTPTACDQATVYITVGELLIPDFSPTVFAGNTTIIGTSGVVDFRVFVGEYNNQNSNGVDSVELRIIKNPGLVITYDDTLTTLNGTPVDNTSWVYDGSNPSLHKFTYIGNGGLFQASSASNIGINAIYNPPINTNGAFPLKVTIRYFSGGEVNNTNNDDIDYIEYTNNTYN